MTRISQQQLESHLWGAAALLRGTIDARDYKQFIFPLLFYKRLCDVFDEEKREEGTEALLKELDDDGPKYKRFGNVIERQKEVRAALVKLLKEQFGITPSSDENEIAQQTIEATSTFESQPLTRLRWPDLDHELVRQLIAAAEGRRMETLSSADLLAGACGQPAKH
ncbi:MAG: type I restriction-modification system subunit M N-terminal domain-containing protein [Candidatus Sumerlaeota bacterium]|nr:type I restriction-modification system subunit M N-terminal domain-containing protein [Candidatus Sumerlaeota bacterium]